MILQDLPFWKWPILPHRTHIFHFQYYFKSSNYHFMWLLFTMIIEINYGHALKLWNLQFYRWFCKICLSEIGQFRRLEHALPTFNHFNHLILFIIIFKNYISRFNNRLKQWNIGFYVEFSYFHRFEISRFRRLEQALPTFNYFPK